MRARSNVGCPSPVLAAVLVMVAFGAGACDRSSHRAAEVAVTPATFPTGKTYHKDVQPILQNNCEKCHQEGGIGPMTLASYADAFDNAQKIAEQTYARVMPPWMPAVDCGSFKNSRRLTQAEIDTLVGWYLDGAPEGDPADAPSPFVPAPDLDPVDLTMRLPTPYTPNAALTDDYRCFVFTPELDGDKELVAFEVVPGDRREVHHALLYAVDTAQAMAADAADPGPGYTCFGGPGVDTTGVIGAWAPGAAVVRFPTDTGILLAPGTTVALQIHYNLANGVFPDQTEVRYQFAKTPVAKRGQILSLANAQFAIPPLTNGYSATVTKTAPANVVLWGMAPHMHTRGRSATITRDSGQCLIDIPSWDFHWQDFYFSDSPTGIPIAKGETLTLTCTWDNPEDRTIRWGESTSDEMCIAYYYITAQ